MIKTVFFFFSLLMSMGIWLPGTLMAKEITIGSLFDRSGPTAALGRDYRKGCLAAIRYFNRNGGANDHPVQLIDSDTSFNEKKILNYYQKYKQEGVFAILGWGSKDTHILKESVQKDNIVYMSSSYDGLHTNPRIAPFSFFVASSYSDQIRAAMQFAKENGAQKVVFIYPDLVFGKAPIPAGKDFAKAIGLEIQGDVPLRWKEKNLSAKLKKLKKSKPDFAWVGSTTDQFSSILNTAARLKLRTRFVVNCWGIDETLPKRINERARSLAYGVMPIVPFAEDVPGIEPIRSMVKEGDARKHTVHFIKGWLSSLVLCEGIKRAERAGDLSGPGLKKALESLQDYNTGGLTPENITYSNEDHRPITSSYIYRIHEDQLKMVKAIRIERKREYLGW